MELAKQSDLVRYINQTVKTKIYGWSDAGMILSLVLLNLAGGDCISDIDRLEQDEGLRMLLVQFATYGMRRKERRAFERRWRKAKSRGLPSNAAIHRYFPQFHSPDEEKNREEGETFIPKPNDKLSALIGFNTSVRSFVALSDHGHLFLEQFKSGYFQWLYSIGGQSSY